MTQQISPPDETGLQNETRRFVIPIWVWVAAAAAFGFFAITLWQSRRLTSQLAELRKQVQQEQNRKETLEAERRNFEQFRALLASSATHEIRLSAEGTDKPIVRAFWNETLGMALSAENMPALGPNRVYQLWIVPKKGSPISAGTFKPDASGKVLQLTRVEGNIRVKEARALTISEEPTGGSAQPTTTPAWVWPLR